MPTPTGGYGPDTSRFVAPDWPSDYTRPLSLNRWAYVEANPINFTDPSGHCRGQYTTDPSDCDKFVNEVQRLITLAKSRGGPFSSSDSIVRMLAAHYSGIKLTVNLLGLEILNPCLPELDPAFANTVQDRWLLPDPTAYQVFQTPPVSGAKEAALKYGFKREFYSNTHHYFAVFYSAWFYGAGIAGVYNAKREFDQVQQGQSDYANSAADVLVAEVAIKHVKKIQEQLGLNIGMLPSYLKEDACGDSLEAIYAEWTWPNPTVERVLGPPPN